MRGECGSSMLAIHSPPHHLAPLCAPLPYTTTHTHTPHLLLPSDWGEDEKDAEDAEAWGDDWEDQATEDDFIGQLRAELEKNA